MNHKSEHSVELMCRVLGVNKSGYYYFCKSPVSNRDIKNTNLTLLIKKEHEKSKEVYGSPRITASLKQQGIACSRPRVARLMNKAGIKSKIRKSYKKTTNSNHLYDKAPNLLNQNFKVNAPSQVWVSDITYIKTKEGWLYLTMIMDLFNREIISFHRSKTLMAQDTTIPALKKAFSKRKPINLIFHSDKGVQYACDEFRELLKSYGFEQSMSGKGNCYDNAPSESFFKTLKCELIYLKKGGYSTIKQAGAEIFEFIECFYNTVRLHSFLGFLSPKNYMKLFMKNKFAA